MPRDAEDQAVQSVALAGIASIVREHNPTLAGITASLRAGNPAWADLVKPPAMQSAALAGIASIVREQLVTGVQLDSYESAARALFKELGATDLADNARITFAASPDARTYEALAEMAPEVAEAVDRAAAAVTVAFWDRKVIRNSLAGLVFAVIMTAYAVSGLLPPPWDTVALSVLAGGGVTAPAAFKRVRGAGSGETQSS